MLSPNACEFCNRRDLKLPPIALANSGGVGLPDVTDGMVEALRERLWATWGAGRQTTDWPTLGQLREALEAAWAARPGS